MNVKLRYVTARRNKRDGSIRWYWQRKGHPLTRLPDDETNRLALATKLNEQADHKDGEALVEGSIGWVVAKYKASDGYRGLAPGTLKYYNRYLAEIEEMGKGTPFASISRRDVVDFVETFTGKGEPRKVAAVFSNLYNTALYYSCATANHAAGLRLSASKPRSEFWTDGEESAWLKAVEDHPKAAAMRMAFALLIYTAQRPGDVLAMGWTQYDGDTIRLRQQKTRKLLDVPCHRALRAILDAEQGKRASTVIVTHDGRPMSYPAFNRAFAEISLLAGVEGKQARDLRRTGMLRMAAAGATDTQIASVSGHSIEATKQILETYLPRNVTLAREAIARLEERSTNKIV